MYTRVPKDLLQVSTMTFIKMEHLSVDGAIPLCFLRSQSLTLDAGGPHLMKIIPMRSDDSRMKTVTEQKSVAPIVMDIWVTFLKERNLQTKTHVTA